MINVIVSMTSKNTEQELKNTLNSIDTNDMSVLVVSSAGVNIHSDIFPQYSNIKHIFNTGRDDEHSTNFYHGIYNANENSNILTFVKAGDIFCGRDVFPIVEQAFDNDVRLTTVRGRIRNKHNYNLYNSPVLNLQGWFFKKDFLDYYTFVKTFKHDVEFALNLTYIAHLNKFSHMDINLDMVQVMNPVEYIGPSCVHYFNEALPQQNFFNSHLGACFIFDILCDCYITYVQAANDGVSEDEMRLIMRDIQTFYDYFAKLELDDLTILLSVYNLKMQKIYSAIGADSFTKKIPSISLVEFLNLHDREEVKE